MRTRPELIKGGVKAVARWSVSLNGMGNEAGPATGSRFQNAILLLHWDDTKALRKLSITFVNRTIKKFLNLNILGHFLRKAITQRNQKFWGTKNKKNSSFSFILIALLLSMAFFCFCFLLYGRLWIDPTLPAEPATLLQRQKVGGTLPSERVYVCVPVSKRKFRKWKKDSLCIFLF